MRRAISQYIVYGVAFCIIAVIIAMAFSAYNSTEREIAQHFNNQQLILANEAAVGIENLFAEVEVNMVGLSQRVSANTGETLTQDMEYSFNILKSKVSRVFYLDPDGMLAQSYSLRPEIHGLEDESLKKYFTWAMDQFRSGFKGPLVSGIFCQPNGHKDVIVCVPVFFQLKDKKGRLLDTKFGGVLGSVVEVPTIVELYVASIRPARSGYAWLLDSRGTLIYHPEHSEMADLNIFRAEEGCHECHVSFDLEKRIIQEGVAGQATYQVPQSGKYKLLAYSPIKVGNRFWLVVVATPYSEITLLVRRSFRNTMLLITTAVIVIFFAALYVLKLNKMWIITREEAKHLEQENRLQQEIKKTKDYLEQILFSAGEAIISTDSQGRITTWNRASEGMFGYAEQDVIGQPMQLIMPDEKSRAKLTQQLDKVAGEGHWEGEQVYARKEGDTFIGWCTMMAVRDDSAPEQLIGYISVIRDITEWKQLEQSLRESEEKYRTLIEETQEAVVVLQGTEIVYVNPAFLKMFGYQNQAQVLGKSLEANTAPESLKIVKQRALKRRRGQKLPTHFEYKGLKADGTKFDIEVDAKLITYKGKPALQAFLRDVTDRKKTEQEIKKYSVALEREIEERTKELRESQQLLEAISESAPLEIAVVDSEGEFVYVNKFWEWITGISRGKALGSKVDELCPQLTSNPQFSQMMRRTFEDAQSQNHVEVNYKEQIGPYAGGEVNKIFWSIPFFGEDDEVNRAAFMGYNVTEIKRLERQLVQSEKLVATGKLAAGIAHEINSPIYGIQGCLESILNDTRLDPKDRRFVELSYRETQRITNLIRRLQDFYRPSDEVMVAVNVNEIIRDVLLLEASYLKQARIKVHTRYKRKLPPVLATGDQLKQVFINLISNSRDAMSGGGDLTIITKADNNSVLISFIDTGCGISKENQSKVFDAFFTTKREVKGVGLGLSVSYGIIARHNGRIEVESELGKGTRFTVILPAYRAAVGQEAKI
jgi:PAS domain S-box-containing protein